jgi:four helix bundle protein
MDNKTFGDILEARTRKFASAVIRFSMQLPYTPEAVVIRRQLTKSGTSIGANYEVGDFHWSQLHREANRARSRADFKSRIKICESEASETQYWLEVVTETGWSSRDKIREIFNECRELLAFFASIGKSVR